MICVALFFDVLQWLLAFVFMDWLATIFAYMTFWMWFTMKGIKLLTPKRFAIQSGTLLIEVIPFVAALPAITCMVVLTVIDAKLKERGISLQAIGATRAKEIRAKNAGMAERVKANMANQMPDKEAVEKIKKDTAEKMKVYNDEARKRYEPEHRQRLEEWGKWHEENDQVKRDIYFKQYGGKEKWDKDSAETTEKLGNRSWKDSSDKAA